VTDEALQPSREQWELNKQAAERAHERSDELISHLDKAALADAKTVIRSLILINGAAAISIMTFVGALTAKSSVPADQIAAIATGLEWFAMGVLSATLTACFAYLTDIFYEWAEQMRERNYEHPFLHANTSSRKSFYGGRVTHFLAVASTVASLVAFVGGVWFVSGSVKAISASSLSQPSAITAPPAPTAPK
jgi:hypothetical protein